MIATRQAAQSPRAAFSMPFCGHIKGQGEKMVEEWKDIEGFEGAYMISNTGKVLSILSIPRRGTKHRTPAFATIGLIVRGVSYA